MTGTPVQDREPSALGADSWRHTVARLGEAEVSEQPFPHFLATDFLPAHLYEELVQAWPTPDAFKSVKLAHYEYPDRLITRVEPAWLAALDPNRAAVWQRVKEFFSRPEFLRALLGKFAIVQELLRSNPTAKLTLDLRPCEDRAPYSLGPHTDAPHKIIAGLLYLPEGEDQVELGTAIYRHKDPDFQCDGYTHHRRDDFDLIGQAPFRPNHFFAFARTQKSFHGVEPVTSSKPRRLVLFNVYRMDAKV